MSTSSQQGSSSKSMLTMHDPMAPHKALAGAAHGCAGTPAKK